MCMHHAEKHKLYAPRLHRRLRWENSGGASIWENSVILLHYYLEEAVGLKEMKSMVVMKRNIFLPK